MFYSKRMQLQTAAEIIGQPKVVADDARGIIEQLTQDTFNSVLRITSKAGSVRANHYHRRDSHLCYLTYGKLRYVWRDALDEKLPLQETIIKPGQLFYTPPMVAHAMHFLEDSEFYTFSTSARATQGDYEEDIVRVILVDSNVA